MQQPHRTRTAEQEIEIEARLRTGKLSLRGLGLTKLPEPLFALTHLVALDLRNNSLTELPNNLPCLRNLREIFINNNGLSTFPTILLAIDKLEVLELSGNSISALPEELSNLEFLVHLNISNNPGISIPETISKLTSLRDIVAANNSYREIPSALLGCRSILSLNVSGNPINEISTEFTALVNLRRLSIDTNTLRRPPIEIVSRGPGAIINYLHAFGAHSDAFVLKEAKLLMVGQGGVGKSFLVERLVKDAVPSKDKTTEGIHIHQWTPILSNGETARINCWDFGGQEIYHSTHQFFLTKRSLYLFVWDSRREDNILHFDYWLNVIKLLSDSSPVLVVQNKADERIKMLDEVSLREKFANIAGFHRVSAITGLGIPDLRVAALGLVRKLEHFGDTLPSSWLHIRVQLEKLPEHYIAHERYLDICSQQGLNAKQADYLSQYFHDLGVFLHFQDNDILRKIIFLKPEWATNAVYQLIDDRSVQEAFGRFSLRMLDDIWSEIPDVRHLHLVELMKKFELCFQVPMRHEYVIPELLNTVRPDFYWNELDNLHFHFVYDFMPAGILTRLIVRMQSHTKTGAYWKNGVVFASEESEALVIAHPLQRRLTIQISGAEKGTLLSMIRREIDAIHSSMNSPTVRQMLPCVCAECRESENPYMHEFDYLQKAKKRQKYTVECKQSLDDVRVDDILRDVRESMRLRRERIMRSSQEGMSTVADVDTDIDEVATIGDLVVRRNYSPDIFPLTGVSAVQYSDILKQIASLSPSESKHLDGLLQLTRLAPNEIEPFSRIGAFLRSHRVPIGQNLSASALYDLIKYVFAQQ